MNTIQAQANVSASSGSGANEVVDTAPKIAVLSEDNAASKTDHYSATAANDAVVARVITNSITRNFSDAQSIDRFSPEPSSDLLDVFTRDAQNDGAQPDIASVTNNVVGFVESALAKLATRGFDHEKLTFFREEAIKGVEVGIEQAKLDLIGLANDETFKTIDETRDSIVSGIQKLPVNPEEYEALIASSAAKNNGTNATFGSVSINTAANLPVTLDFETRAFNASSTDVMKSIHTTSSSNISFAIQGSVAVVNHQNIADFLNKTDGLANSFYRDDIEGAYNKSVEQGFSDLEIIGMAKQLSQSDKFQQVKVYEDIEQSTSISNPLEYAAPKAVAQYVNRYLDVLESGKSVLADSGDFNQIINGLVNQMKDVQVPDLLQAINRFHIFNSKFG